MQLTVYPCISTVYNFKVTPVERVTDIINIAKTLISSVVNKLMNHRHIEKTAVKEDNLFCLKY